MQRTKISPKELDRRGQELYKEKLRPLVETPENIGKHLVMDVESCDYEIDTDGIAASRRLQARHPGARLYGVRIGYNAVYAFGGNLRRTTEE